MRFATSFQNITGRPVPLLQLSVRGGVEGLKPSTLTFLTFTYYGENKGRNYPFRWLEISTQCKDNRNVRPPSFHVFPSLPELAPSCIRLSLYQRHFRGSR